VIFRGKLLLQFQRLGIHAETMPQFYAKVSNYSPAQRVTAYV
jgi:hypothetical protein